MDMQDAIRAVTSKRDLTSLEMSEVMTLLMSGQATPAQIGGFLVGLRMKGETVEEITAAASIMRGLSLPVSVTGPHLLDTCGTGGDGAHTFNISTAVAFVAAAAGAKVAKHGNRSVSSHSGSADVLEAAGVYLDLTPEQSATCIEQVGVGFLFAPRHHGATKHAVGPRREMGIRTLFNLLGPLTNPAGAPSQLMGVFAEEWRMPVAEVLRRLGSRHVLVVHAEDGTDEISLGAPTRIAELRNGEISNYVVSPEDFGLTRAHLSSLTAKSPCESLALLYQALEDVPGPARDVVMLNAGAAIYAADLVSSLKEGVERSKEVLATGKARDRLTALVNMSQSFRTKRQDLAITPKHHDLVRIR
ncbi:Anthranilate phosphoribosyltransferase [Gammaproteobacteria bacterium]